MIRVLIADDSAVLRQALRYAVERDPDMEVAGVAENGRQAVSLAAQLKPDVIAMDFQMPDMDGIEATRRIMQDTPTPIVIVSAVLDPEEAAANFRALEAGALSLLQKPRLSGEMAVEALDEIASSIKLMSEVRVVRRIRRPEPPPKLAVLPARPAQPVQLVCMGASTGGPQALQTILCELDAHFAAPILVTQHISPGFLLGMVSWLNSFSQLQVKVAEHGEQALPGYVYFAPEDRHLAVDGNFVLRESDDPPVNRLRPAVNYMFTSAAEALGARALGVLLTGMGKDGAEGLLRMRTKGCLTVAQDKESSVVHGMPGAAIELNAVRHIAPLSAIGGLLANAVRPRNASSLEKQI